MVMIADIGSATDNVHTTSGAISGGPEGRVMSEFPIGIWAVTIVGLIGVVVLDLTVIARRNRTVTMRDATIWVSVYVLLASGFATALFALGPPATGGEFVAGYITEYSLSVDNLFVFMIIMARFAVPPLGQDKALYIGIVGSMVLRAVFIAAGAGAVAAASWVFYLFGALLFYTAARLIIGGQDGEFNESALVWRLRRVLPIGHDYVGSRVIARVDGRRKFTPLILVIAAICIANVVFALDSIPAIFGLTSDAYVIFTANAFALMGLRQLFFLVGDLLNRLIYLNTGLAVVLGFIGVKLTFEALADSHVRSIGPVALPQIGIAFSLVFIGATLGITAAVSLIVSFWRERLRHQAELRATRATVPLPAAPLATETGIGREQEIGRSTAP
jgi:TerC family integral membrane protein